MEATTFLRMRNTAIAFSFEGNFASVFVASDLFLLWCSEHNVLHQEGESVIIWLLGYKLAVILNKPRP